MPYLRRCLREQGLSDKELAAEMDKHDEYFRIVDGNFRLWAISQLMDEQPDMWGSFKWTMLVLKGTTSMNILRQMKRTLRAQEK